MSTSYRTYGKRLDAFAKEIFDEIQTKESTYKDAERKHRAFPYPPGAGRVVDAEYITTAANAAATYERAKADLENTRQMMPDRVQREVNKIRGELTAAVKVEYTARPGDVDRDTLTLMESGILTADEFENLMQLATNPTMKRLIAASAAKAAKTEPDETAAARLRCLAEAGKNLDGSETIELFDGVAETLQRSVDNPHMIPYWAELVEPMIEAM